MMDRPLPPRRRSRWKLALGAWFVISILGLIAGGVRASLQRGIPVEPAAVVTSGPAVQVYAARTWGAKKAAAVHTWIATRRSGEKQFRVHEVIGWYQYRGRSPLITRTREPDTPWYGNPAELLVDLRGAHVDAVIDQVEAAIASYPYTSDYRAWPGPNSNTFTAWVGRQVPSLELDLPSTAIGKDYGVWFGRTTSGSGVQLSLGGVLGFAIGPAVGLELNALGLNYELDLLDLGLEIPGFGRVGSGPLQ